MDVFGTMEDVEELIKAVHDRKMRIIFDLVLNHTSEFVVELHPLNARTPLVPLVNILGSLNLDRRERILNVTGTYGEMANPVVFVRTIGRASSTVPPGNTIEKPTSTTCICSRARCPMSTGNVQNYGRNSIA